MFHGGTLTRALVLDRAGGRVRERVVSYTERAFTEEDPCVELLLCASELARLGVEFALSAAVEALDLAYSDVALEAAFAAREVGALYGDSMSADSYLEAAYRVMQGSGAG